MEALLERCTGSVDYGRESSWTMEEHLGVTLWINRLQVEKGGPIGIMEAHLGLGACCGTGSWRRV